MRYFEIVDGMLETYKPCALLVYDTQKNKFTIHIYDWAEEDDLPMLLGSFAAKGEKIIGDEWARRWIEERVVPARRQNIGQILKANGLDYYDPFELLVRAKGRCSQDDFYINEIDFKDLKNHWKLLFSLAARLKKCYNIFILTK